jgi:UDP-N-acetylglucosamine 2-epimerase (non-hydrolysing)
MPEENNRILTDHVSSYLFTPSEDADINLKQENILSDNIFFVGNIMIDTLIASMSKIDNSPILETLELKSKITGGVLPFNILTLHRPSNVDDHTSLSHLIESIVNIPNNDKVIFPVHPRSQTKVEILINKMKTNKIVCIKPLGYIEFLSLLKHAKLVITDSGGIQEETTYLGTPCITLRTTTERPVTINVGTNTLINPTESNLTDRILESIQLQRTKQTAIPKFWDGKTSERIADVLVG